MEWLPIIGPIFAAVNAWVIFLLGRRWDKEKLAAESLDPLSTDSELDRRIHAAKRRTRWYTLIGTVFPLIGVVLTLIPPVSRLSMFFIFLFSVYLSFTLNASLEMFSDLNTAQQWRRLADSLRQQHIDYQSEPKQIK